MTDLRPAPALPARAIWGWVLFDWAAQPVFTLITTFVYAPYFASAVASSPVEGQAAWGYATSLAGVFIALMSPFLGAVADASGRRKPWIAAFGLLLVIGCAGLWLGVPGRPETMLPALIFFVIALIGVEFATVFNNAMMPALAPPEKLGRLSGLGWAIGYVGGMLSLILTLGFLAGSPVTGKTLLGFSPLFGLEPVLREGDRASGPLSALWFFVFVVPMFLFTPDLPKREPLRRAVKIGLAALAETLRHARDNRNIMLFLIANMIYADGLLTLFTFGGIYGAGVFGWSVIELGLFGIVLTITGTIGALLGGRADDRFGPKRTIVAALIILLLSTLAALSVDKTHIFFLFEVAPKAVGSAPFSSVGERVYLLIGMILGLAAGPSQAASRTLLARLAPKGQVGQYFGLFALSGRVTSFVGPFSVALITDISQNQRIGVATIALFFIAGLALLLKVRSPA